MVRIMASAAVSLDGYLDDFNDCRLRLSSPEDWDAVMRLRSGCDAILVGAETVRKDNPSLVIKDTELRALRQQNGLKADIDKIVVTRSGHLDPDSNFFQSGNGRKLIVTDNPLVEDSPLRSVAEIVRLEKISALSLSDLFESLGYSQVLIEGGEQIHRMFFESGIIDRFRLAVAPFFVGDEKAPRLFREGTFPWRQHRRMVPESVELMGDTSVITLTNPMKEDMTLLSRAIEISELSPPCGTCYRVGAVIKTLDGEIFTGYTHETGLSNHAEEEAIFKARKARADMRGASIYTSLEPCTKRKSKPVSCTDLIIEHGFSKVFIAAREPAVFVRCEGITKLEENDIEVIFIEEYESKVYKINGHLPI